ncbi:MAG: large subunit ribosomal protein [Candidatus Woesearchaeota archaeon]|nr:large subunit ribosomal protein [Candidatus Woesearchaeota archaeon]
MIIVIIFDAKDMIFGRIATRIAKEALLGNDVVVVNTKDVCISGKKEEVLKSFKERFDSSHPLKGPFYPKEPARLFKRMLRGMLPYKKERGKVAFSRIKCYAGVPKSLEGKEFIRIEEANINKIPRLKYVRLGDISKILGGKE